jgi:hypothetical protein
MCTKHLGETPLWACQSHFKLCTSHTSSQASALCRGSAAQDQVSGIAALAMDETTHRLFYTTLLFSSAPGIRACPSQRMPLLAPFVPVLLIAAAGNAKRLSAMLPFARALVPSLDRMMALETRVIRPALAPRSARFVSFCRRSAWRSTGQGHRCQLRARRLRVDGHSAGHTAPELPDPHPAWSCPSSSSFCLLLPDRQTHSESPSPDLHCGQANYSACDTSSLQSPALPGPILRPEQTASF